MLVRADEILVLKVGTRYYDDNDYNQHKLYYL